MGKLTIRWLPFIGVFFFAAALPAVYSSGQTRYGTKGEVVYEPRYGNDLGKSKEWLNGFRGLFKLRDDMLWHAEAANVAYHKAGNVSLLSASRYGVTEKLELSTYLVEDVARPTIYAKRLWAAFDKRRWLVSSRFDIANAYPGMRIAKRKEIERIIRPDAKVPLVFEVGHELLVSRAWYTDPNCSDGSAYLILTGGLGLYAGIKCADGDTIDQPRFHFIANRSETLIDNGFRARFKFWADGRLPGRVYLHGGIAYHTGFFNKRHAVELQGEAEYFLTSQWSVKAGFLTSFAHYEGISSHAAIWPIVDVTFYFGQRNKAAQGNLFNRKERRETKDHKSKHRATFLHEEVE